MARRKVQQLGAVAGQRLALNIFRSQDVRTLISTTTPTTEMLTGHVRFRPIFHAEQAMTISG